MPRKLTFPLTTLLLSVALLFSSSPDAHADTISLTLTSPLVLAAPGSTVSFYATATAPGANSADVFLNSDSFTVSAPLTLDDTDYFLDFPFFLAPGQSFTGELFTVSIPSTTLLGNYTGFFDMLGGPNGSSASVLASAPFTVQATPEPSSFLLLAAGIAGIVAKIRRVRRDPMHPTTFRNPCPRRRGKSNTVLAVLAVAVAQLTLPHAEAQVAGSIDFTSSQQVIQGFGFSDAFGEANTLQRFPAASQTAILNLLFSRQSGAGFSILRVGINTDSYIEPNSPGSPSATPTYAFDGSDGGQVWLAQNGQKYGLGAFYADAWSAPAFMKTNNSLDNGGYLCGEIGETCSTGDWRTAYANFLLQYVNFYGGVGIPIGNLGFVNEPDQNVTYQSLLFTTAQAVDFIKVIGPIIQSSGLPLNLFCCDGSKWSVQTPFTQAIVADPVASAYVNVISSHEYGSHATSPQPTAKPVWMTEWSSSNGTFQPLWDCNGCSGGPDGMYLANDIIQAFNAGNVNAYLYWWGTSSGAAALILTTPPTYTVAGRFYAIASFSRFVRPGAVMVSSTNSNSSLNAVAFRNTDGSKVLGVINTASSAINTSFTVDAGTANSTAQTYLTDSSVSLTETDTATVTGQTLNLSLPARSLTMVTLPPAIVPGTVELDTTTSVALLGDGSYQATVTITNNGTGTAQNLQLTGALLGSATGIPAPGTTLPQSLGNIAPGGFLTTSVNFPSSAGSPTSRTVARFTGSYQSGTFGGSARIVLP